jgi:DNA polymerase
MLEEHLVQVKADKATLLASCGVDSTTLMSTAKFRKALEDMGVVIQTKITASGKETPAFAKTDKFMEELGEHPDPQVQALAAARLGLKSTIEETRTEKLLSIAGLPWQTLPDGTPRLYSGGTIPVPLRFGGAHTHRLSGDWGMNLQNLPSVRGSKGKSKLRHSLTAPPGHTVIVADLGQIEARLVAFLCGCTTLLNQFAKKMDPYSMLASSIFGRPINRKLAGTPDEVMGFIGKTGILGLGYGAGKDKFDSMVLASARSMAIDLSLIGYTRAIGDKAVDSYRKDYYEIPTGWRTLDNILATVWLHGGKVKFGPCEIERGAVILPNGMRLEYGDPQSQQVKYTDDAGKITWRTELFYRYGKMLHKIYGAKFLENITQAIARIIVMNAALRIRDRGKYRPCPHAYFFAMQAHDELVYIVPDDEVEHAKKVIHEEMTRPPSWGKELPLTADVGTGASYGEAK